MTDAEDVAVAVASGQGLDRLAARLTDPSLLAVVEAARQRLVPELSPSARRLLRKIGAFPGRSAAELREVAAIDGDFGAASSELLAAGLVESSRFEVADCWVRTARGTAVSRSLSPEA